MNLHKSAHKFTQVAMSPKFHTYTVDLRSVAKQWLTCVDFELDQSQRKSMQVDGQMKCKLNVSWKFASPFGSELYTEFEENNMQQLRWQELWWAASNLLLFSRRIN